MDKLIFADEFIPVKEEAVRSILDYEIEIYALSNEDKQYSALNMNYSVAGFKLVLARKMSFYVVTYYLPSGLFVIVSWVSYCYMFCEFMDFLETSDLTSVSTKFSMKSKLNSKYVLALY